MSKALRDEIQPLVRYLRHAKDNPPRMSVLDDYRPDTRTLAWVLDAINSWASGETGNAVDQFAALSRPERPQ